MITFTLELQDDECKNLKLWGEEYFPGLSVQEVAKLLAGIGMATVQEEPVYAAKAIRETLADLAELRPDEFGEVLPKLDGKGW